ncbi:MAG: Bro-N domain-containing protein [Candidatus Kaiserbacteria bacterium]|nr:Bro-N domain-containing protein [Candidatus Kaiserbacteria bacterium]
MTKDRKSIKEEKAVDNKSGLVVETGLLETRVLPNMDMKTTKIVLFKNKQVRKTLYHNEWWFVVNDVIEALTDSRDPAQYFKRLKERDEELAKLTDKGGVQFVPPLMLDIKTPGGIQKAYCWHTEGIFRLIQSIPSPKAEPFKRWLAKVGYERVQEIENPELATKRTRMLYKLKGYSEDWIEKRMRGIAIREELTDEWQQRLGRSVVTKQNFMKSTERKKKRLSK